MKKVTCLIIHSLLSIVILNARQLSFFQTDTFPPVAKYINRASFLLSQGRPAAKIGLYFPSLSLWYGDNESNTSLLSVSQQLMENQRDFDFIDEQALASVLSSENGTLINDSRQAYSTIVVPSISVISNSTLQKLKKLADAGGKVIFMNKQPDLVIEKTFYKAGKIENITWALTETSGKITPASLNFLPPSDLKLGKFCADIKYTHRNLKDAELYFIFNEGKEKRSVEVTLTGKGTPEIWDAMTGEVSKIEKFKKSEGKVILLLDFDPNETKFIVINK